jgi:PAS domain S-box-containing protein
MGVCNGSVREPGAIHGFLIIGECGTIESINDRASELLAIDLDGLLGKHWTTVIDRLEGSDFSSLRAAIEDGLTGRVREANGGAFLIPANGARREWKWGLSRMIGGNSQSTLCLTLLGGAAVAPAAPLEMALQSYRDTFDYAVEGIFRTSLDGRYIDVNTSLAKMYGFASPAELMSALRDLNTQLYVHSGRRAEFVRLIREQGFVRDFESEVYRADGSRMWIAEYARTVFNGGHQPLFYEGSVIDITEHRLAEAKLRESEERFRLLVETMNLLPWEADIETRRFTYVGPQAISFLGFSIDEWSKEGFWSKRIHPEDRDWVEVVQSEALEKGDSFESEYRVVRADGRVIWIRDMTRVITSNAGRILGGFMLDVTYRRATEASLQKSQYFFEQLIDASSVILYLYDMGSQRCLHVNGRVGEILGYTADALAEMNPFFVIALGHPDELAQHRDHFEKLSAFREGDIIERDFRLRAAGGNWVWLRSRESVFKDSRSGEPQKIVGTATDITVRRIAFEELVNNETLFRNLAETTKAIPFEYDLRNKRFSYIGPQAPSLLGYPLSRWYHPGFWETIIHGEDVEAAMRFTRSESERLQVGSDVQTEFRLKKSDGDYVWLAQVVRCTNANDPHQQARGFLFDLTEAKEREQEIERSRILMRQLALRVQAVREEERKNIARELHDELGQALTLFRIELEWLETRFAKLGISDLAIEEKLPEMKKMAGGTLHTMRRILTSLRPPVLDEFGLIAALEWQAGEFSRRVGIRCDLQTEPIECADMGLATAIFRTFQEILTNIARHAHASSVKVKLGRTPAGVMLTVSDNGRGFLPSDAEREKSFGLLGMRERAESLGGMLTISSTISVGTTVTVVLPLSFDIGSVTA